MSSIIWSKGTFMFSYQASDQMSLVQNFRCIEGHHLTSHFVVFLCWGDGLMNHLGYVGKKKLKDLLQQSDNRTCADCGAHDPKWA